MKAVAINGSQRKGGNTEILLKKVIAPLAAAGWETEFVQIGGTDIRGCKACYHCFETKNARCGQKDAAFNPCLEKMLAADAIILGSPTYFTDVSTRAAKVTNDEFQMTMGVVHWNRVRCVMRHSSFVMEDGASPWIRTTNLRFRKAACSSLTLWERKQGRAAARDGRREALSMNLKPCGLWLAVCTG